MPAWCQVLYWAWANGGVDVKREFLGDVPFVYLNWVIFHQLVSRQLTIRLFVRNSGFFQAAHSFRSPKYEAKSTYITVVKQPHLTSICTDTQVYKTLIHYEIERSFIFWFVWPFHFPVIFSLNCVGCYLISHFNVVLLRRFVSQLAPKTKARHRKASPQGRYKGDYSKGVQWLCRITDTHWSLADVYSKGKPVQSEAFNGVVIEVNKYFDVGRKCQGIYTGKALWSANCLIAYVIHPKERKT